MVLIGVQGSPRSLNKHLLLHAVRNAPCLFIDCANSANLHSLFAVEDLEHLDGVFVMQTELIYTFRDILKMVPAVASQLGVRCVVVTTFNRLFHYSDEVENKDIIEHVWELLRKLSRSMDIYIGITDEGASCDKVIRWDTLSGARELSQTGCWKS
jgi:hypothetical protein